MSKHRLKPHVIVIDETEHWCLDDDLMVHIERIETVYLYDDNTVFHLCEITPSFELWPIVTRAIFIDEGNTSDEIKDRADADILQWSDHSQVTYVHFYDIQRMNEANPKKHKRLTSAWCDDYQSGMEGYEEYLRGNEVI